MSAKPLQTCPTARIDLSALQRNYQFFADLAQHAQTAAAVKANAYGLGLDPVCRVLRDAGCRTFFVAHLGEGLSLRKTLGPDCQIFVLHGVAPTQTVLFKANDLIPVLNSDEQLDLWQKEASSSACALHFDTGFSRLGLSPSAISKKIKEMSKVMVMSHLSCGSEPDHPKNQQQLHHFQEVTSHFCDSPRSLANSAGCLLGKEYHFDMVRPGIGLYGGAPLEENSPKLSTVVELQAPVLQTKLVRKGHTVGYGASWLAETDTEVAILAYGYADGLLRSSVPNCTGWYKGQKTPLIGRISMDLSVVDISHLPRKPNIGDSIQFLGHDLDQFAIGASTAPYEVLTGIGQRVQREYTGNAI